MPLVPELDGNLLLCQRQATQGSNLVGDSLLVTYLVVCEGKQLFPQSVSILYGPLVGQESLNGISSLEELISVSPCRVWSVRHLHRRGLPKTGISTGLTHNSDCRRTCFVFQAFWAAFTFMLAVSAVKGGNGGLDSVAMLLDL